MSNTQNSEAKSITKQSIVLDRRLWEHTSTSENRQPAEKPKKAIVRLLRELINLESNVLGHRTESQIYLAWVGEQMVEAREDGRKLQKACDAFLSDKQDLDTANDRERVFQIQSCIEKAQESRDQLDELLEGLLEEQEEIFGAEAAVKRTQSQMYEQFCCLSNRMPIRTPSPFPIRINLGDALSSTWTPVPSEAPSRPAVHKYLQGIGDVIKLRNRLYILDKGYDIDVKERVRARNIGDSVSIADVPFYQEHFEKRLQIIREYIAARSQVWILKRKCERDGHHVDDPYYISLDGMDGLDKANRVPNLKWPAGCGIIAEDATRGLIFGSIHQPTPSFLPEVELRYRVLAWRDGVRQALSNDIDAMEEVCERDVTWSAPETQGDEALRCSTNDCVTDDAVYENDAPDHNLEESYLPSSRYSDSAYLVMQNYPTGHFNNATSMSTA